MMMVYKLILLLLNLNLSASENEVEFDIGHSFYGRILFETDSSDLYYTYNKISDCELEFNKYNYLNKNLNKFYIKIPEVGKINCSNLDFRIQGFKIKNDTLYIQYRYFIYLYKVKDNETKLIKAIDLQNKINRNSIDQRVGFKFRIYENIIIGYLDSYTGNKDANNNLFVWKYNIDFNTMDTLSAPIPKGYKWTNLQPKNIIDCLNGKIISCDLDEDNLYFIYSQDSISKFKLGIFENDWSIDDQLPINHPADFFTLNKSTTDSIYIIHSVDFLDNDNILVKYSIPKTIETDLFSIFNFCLVSKINGIWKVKNQIEPILIFGNNKCKDSYNYGYDYYISNNKIISKHYPNNEDKNIKNFIRVEDIQDVLNRIK